MAPLFCSLGIYGQLYIIFQESPVSNLPPVILPIMIESDPSSIYLTKHSCTLFPTPLPRLPCPTPHTRRITLFSWRCALCSIRFGLGYENGRSQREKWLDRHPSVAQWFLQLSRTFTLCSTYSSTEICRSLERHFWLNARKTSNALMSSLSF